MSAIDRRGFLVAAGSFAIGAAAPALGRGSQTETVELVVSDKRRTTMLIARPSRVRGVALFSTGQSSWPEYYAPVLIELLTSRGFAVLAPLHVDSARSPDHAKFSAQSAFFERIAELRATSAQAASRFPGKPLIAVGHSYGALFALGLGGALDFIKMRDPKVLAALCFSTPGKIPGLIGPDAYATLTIPTLMITGTKDIIPGFATDPAVHLLPIETAPIGDRFAINVANGDHMLVTDRAVMARVRSPIVDFVDGFGLGKEEARARVRRTKPLPGDRWIVREPV